MDEQTKEPTETKPKDSTPGPQPPKASATPAARPQAKPKITWKAVEPRHYQRAQEKKAAGGKTAYTEYVVSLVERFEGGPVVGLTKAQQEAIVAVFEEKYGG